MIKIKKNILFVIIALLTVSCFQKKENDNNVFTIYIESKNILNTIKLSELISDYKYLPLETTSECLIGRLDKVEIFENDIFTLDMWNSKSVYRFSSEGKFLNRIANRGKGPGEYIEPNDISVNTNSAEITILDRNNKQVLIYKPDNIYLRNIKLPVYAYKLAWYDNNIATYSDREEDLVLLDGRGKQIGAFFNNEYARKMVMEYPFQSYKEKELLYWANFDYTIYNISGKKVTTHLKFVFDKRMFKDNDIQLLKSDEKNRNNFVRIKYYSENSSHVYMVYFFNNAPYMVIYNKLNLKTTIVDVRGIQNDITFTREPPLIMGVTPDNNFISYFDYYDVSKPEELKKIIGTPADDLNEMSNPILLFLKFK